MSYDKTITNITNNNETTPVNCNGCLEYYGMRYCPDCGKKIEYSDTTKIKEKIKGLFTNIQALTSRRTVTSDNRHTSELKTDQYNNAFKNALKYCFRPMVVDITKAENHYLNDDTREYKTRFTIKEVSVYTVEEFLQKCGVNTKNYNPNWLRYGYQYTSLNMNGEIKGQLQQPTAKYYLNGEMIKDGLTDYLDSFKFKENGKLYMIFPCNVHETDHYVDSKDGLGTYNPKVFKEHPIITSQKKYLEDIKKNVYHNEFSDDEIIHMLKHNPLECTKHKNCGSCVDDDVIKCFNDSMSYFGCYEIGHRFGIDTTYTNMRSLTMFDKTQFD